MKTVPGRERSHHARRKILSFILASALVAAGHRLVSLGAEAPSITSSFFGSVSGEASPDPAVCLGGEQFDVCLAPPRVVAAGERRRSYGSAEVSLIGFEALRIGISRSS